jgi:flavin-dependent dehydrogenase
VTVRLPDGCELRGRMLAIADGLDSPVAALARMPLVRQAENVAARAEVVMPAPTADVGLDVIIGARRSPQSGTILRSAGQLRVSLVTREPQPPAETQLTEFLALARAAQMIPSGPHVRPTTSLAPAGAALDMDTHVGKHCVLIGEAGGFVSAFSNEAVYPCMQSGWIAAEVIAKALHVPVPQDELLAFGPAWRTSLADYLRLPNTDLGLLMPLVFSNQQMSRRVARAFLLGQSF